ncbi:PIR Superfamily Protein [Plasmodium ovale curtisi]|uniref:PIR Superfamily Protein n=1 Tax=Plasmodium ovale curtisi TaxID=864141 RepID=A0A1A8XAV7_PLAOA|nr:PIR Superfamily Protein [Plasmodium ovale curtisi]
MKMLIVRFFDTLGKNEELKEYYDKNDCIYNRNSICLSGKEAEVTDCEETEAIEDVQCSGSDISSHNDQAYNIFLLKFSGALEKLLNQYYDSSLLQHYHSKQCVYFKYWFYDKILKNIFSEEKLEHFYKEIEDGDEEDESESEQAEQQFEEGTGELREEYLDYAEEEEEEEEEELAEGSLGDSVEDDIAVSESKYRCKDEDCDSKNTLLALGESNSCNIYKLNLSQIRDLKLLYDYLEDYKSNNLSSVEDEISKSTYCSSFNKTIELYNEKSKCKGDYSDKKFCRELEESWNNYSHIKIHTLSCNTEKPASDPPQQSNDCKELQEARPAPFPRGRGIGSSPSAGLSDTRPEILKGVGFTFFLISPDSTEMVSTVLHNGDHMMERQTLREDKHITASGHPNTLVASSGDMAGSHLMGMEASNPCDNDSVGRSCESSLQPVAPMSTKTENHLKQIPSKNIAVHTEPDVSLQEETGNTNTIVSSASTVLGVSALAFMLYKFTPLGSLINNRRGGMDTWDINEEGYDENLLFSPALGNTNSNNNNYSIGYYSLGNT